MFTPRQTRALGLVVICASLLFFAPSVWAYRIIEQHPFFLSQNNYVDLGLFEGLEGSANDINDNSSVVGTAGFGSNCCRPFIWNNGVFSDLGTLPGHEFASAKAINNKGQIVGESGFLQGVRRPVLWDNSNIVDLGAIGNIDGIAIDINNESDILIASGTLAYVLKQGVLNLIQPLNGHNFVTVTDLNDDGAVIGISGIIDKDSNSLIDIRPFIWKDGSTQEIDVPEGLVTFIGRGITNSGHIAGDGQDIQGKRAGVLLTGTETLFIYPPIGASLGMVSSVNDNDDIVGFVFNHEKPFAVAGFLFDSTGSFSIFPESPLLMSKEGFRLVGCGGYNPSSINNNKGITGTYACMFSSYKTREPNNLAVLVSAVMLSLMVHRYHRWGNFKKNLRARSKVILG